MQMDPSADPEDDPVRRRVLLLISILIVFVSLGIMEWWAGYGLQCKSDFTRCQCAPRGPICWWDTHPLFNK